MEIFTIYDFCALGSWYSWNFPDLFQIITKANHPYSVHMFVFLVIRLKQANNWVDKVEN